MHPTNVVAAAALQGDNFTLTAGDSAGQIGYRSSNPIYGSIVPASPPFLLQGGDEMSGAFSQTSFQFELAPSIIADTDAAWRECRISGTFSLGTGQAIYLRANRTSYTADLFGTTTRWAFTLDALGEFVIGNIYSLNVQL